MGDGEQQLDGIVPWDNESVKLADNINVGDFVQSLGHFLRGLGFRGKFQIWPVVACDTPDRMSPTIRDSLRRLGLDPEFVGPGPKQPKQVADDLLKERISFWRNSHMRRIGDGKEVGEGIVAMLSGDGGYSEVLLDMIDKGFKVVIVHPTGDSTSKL